MFAPLVHSQSTLGPERISSFMFIVFVASHPSSRPRKINQLTSYQALWMYLWNLKLSLVLKYVNFENGLWLYAALIHL